MKKNFKITQAASGNYITWVSQGCGKQRRKAKITGRTPEEVIMRAKKWLKNIEEKRVPYTVKEAILQFIENIFAVKLLRQKMGGLKQTTAKPSKAPVMSICQHIYIS